MAPTSHASAPQRSRLRPAAIAAYLAIAGRIVVMPVLLLMFVLQSHYSNSGTVFIGASDSYLAFSWMDPVMRGGCTNCGIGCHKTFVQLAHFDGAAIMNKPAFEDLFTMTEWNYSMISGEVQKLADEMDDDPDAVCVSGPNEWGSRFINVVGSAQQIVSLVDLMALSVPPQVLLEARHGILTRTSCPTRWVIQGIIRLFKFRAESEFASIPAADFSIFPEYTECRGDVSTAGIVGAKLALATQGVDLVQDVPDVVKLFPYFFSSSLPFVDRMIANVEQPLSHAYYGTCRVREVNTTGIFVEDTCTVDAHWVKYGLMLQAPDDIPVCSTTDVCVHNYYNSLWEYVGGNDTSMPDRFYINCNVVRSRFVDSVEISVLPGMVVVQLLFMGMISLYQTMSHKRSVLLTQIWAYRCQNGRMQLWYLAQITYHLTYNSDLYYLGLTTGTLSVESVGNLTLCFFAFSYSFVNIVKGRLGKQRLDRHFRLTWEIMQLFTTAVVGALLYKHKETSITQIMSENGELLRKTTARGAKYCNLSDSCIVFAVNLGVVMALAALALGFIPFMLQLAVRLCSYRQRRNVTKAVIPREKYVVSGHGSDKKESKPDDGLTSFERECLGVEFTRLFSDCDDFAHADDDSGKRSSSVEAVLLAGFLYYGSSVYQAPAVMLLLLARLVPQSMLRTFNVVLIRWRLDPVQHSVDSPAACTWFAASGEQYKLTKAVPIR